MLRRVNKVTGEERLQVEMRLRCTVLVDRLDPMGKMKPLLAVRRPASSGKELCARFEEPLVCMRDRALVVMYCETEDSYLLQELDYLTQLVRTIKNISHELNETEFFTVTRFDPISEDQFLLLLELDQSRKAVYFNQGKVVQMPAMTALLMNETLVILEANSTLLFLGTNPELPYGQV